MNNTIQYSGTLVVERCYKCAISFAMPAELKAECLRDHRHEFFCPNGHGQVYAGETEAQRLSRQLRSARTQEQWARDQLHASERSKAAIKGHLTRARNKLARGQCPSCDQVFGNVREHMKHKHPDYHLTDIEAITAEESN